MRWFWKWTSGPKVRRCGSERSSCISSSPSAASFEQMFREKRFRVLIVFHSQRRLEAIRRTVAKRTEKLFWFSTQDELIAEGIRSSIWLRPAGNLRDPLLLHTER